MKAPSMWHDLVTWTVIEVEACCLARTCPCSEEGDGLATGGAADVFPVSGCVVEQIPSGWVASALFLAHLPSGVAGPPLCFAQEEGTEAAAAFVLELSFLDA